MLTEATIKDEILSRLGYPVVKVEIDPTQWGHIVTNAKRWFRAKKGVVTCVNIPINQEQQEYPLPDNADTVLDVILPLRSDIQSLLSLGFFDIVPLNAMNIGSVTSAFNSYSSYVQILQALETRRRVFGAEPDWFVSCDKIILTARLSSGTLEGSGMAGHMMVFYIKREWDVSELRGRDEDLFFRYALNEAKYVLGRIRGKYKDYPAAGGNITMDADDLLGDYKEELEKLEEEISDSQGAVPILTG